MGVILHTFKGGIQATEWCEQHISAREYHLPYNKGMKMGGVGWEVHAEAKQISVHFDDPQNETFFCIAFKNHS